MTEIMSESLFYKKTACPLCGANVPASGERFAIRQLDVQVRVVECPVCGIVYKEFVPSENLTNTIYSAEYVHYAQAEGAGEKSSEERVKRMGRSSGRRHLDYGCGGGGLVRCALRQGWDSYGADPFLPDCLTEGPQKERFLKASAESGLLRNLGVFDVVSLWAVIEHLNQPLATFQGLAHSLKPGGKMFLNAPNADSLVARRKGACWGIALLLEHSTFWTEKALRYAAERSGLEVRWLKKCGTPYPFGVSIPSWSSFGLRTPHDEKVESGCGLPDKDATGSLLRFVSLAGQRMARTTVIGNVLRFGLSVLGTGDHYYVVLQKKT
jgi:SAM-dependent methyltransferase